MSDRKRKLDVFSGDASATQNGHALVSPLTGRPYSQRYHDILSKRKGELPSLLPEITFHFRWRFTLLWSMSSSCRFP